MKIRTLGWLVGLSAIASSFLSCTQAKTVCTVGHAGSFIPYIVELQPVSPPACAAMTTTPGGLSSLPDQSPVTLDKMTSDWVGMETYHPTKMINDEVQPDFTKGSVSIQSDTMGNIANYWDPDHVDMDPMDKMYSLGDWSAAEPDTTDFCQVPTFSTQAVQKMGTIPGMAADPMDPMSMAVPCTPGVDVKYEWSNVKIYVTAAAQGTQFTADLKYTQVTHGAPNAMDPTMCDASPDSSCEVTYKARGLWPQVACGVEVPDPTPMDPMHTKMVPDDEQCCPDADPDPAKGRPIGSGINPDFPTKCDPVLLTCVLDAPFDAPLPILGGSKLDICKKLAAANK